MIAILEEWISIEFDHLIGNASNADPITYCLCHKQHDLSERQRRRELALCAHTMVGRIYVRAPCGQKSISDAVIANDTDRELEHDDHDRNCDPHHATESGRRS